MTLSLAALLAVMGSGTAHAQIDPETMPTPNWRLSVEPALVQLTPGPVATQATPGIRTMLWSRQGPLELGLGLEQAGLQPPTTLPGPVPQPRLLLGASINTSDHTALSWRTPVPATLARESLQPQTMEFSLVLKPQDKLASLRRGSLMRLELSGQTQLSFKPRGGGRMTVQLTSKW